MLPEEFLTSPVLGDWTEWAGGKGALIAIIVVGVVVGVPVLIGIIRLLLSFYRKVPQGQALIVNTMKSEPTVTFTGAIVYPIIHKAEIMDISLKTVEIDRRGAEGLICQDNMRADIKVTFFVRVNKTSESVLYVAQTIGCDRASKQQTIEELFIAKFSEALKTVGKQMNFVDLYQERDNFKNRIIETIGEDLSGYKLEDAAIDYLEQTPLESLSEDNILDAVGIKKITDLTAKEKMAANEIRRNKDKVITQQNVDAREKILELERQQSEAELKQKKEVDVIRAQEEAEAKVVAEDQHRRAEQARIASEEEIAKSNENREREVEVARKNKERVIAIETEAVEKARQLEVIGREREVELQRIEKEKAIEVEKKNIADVIRERVAVEKTVAEEEERIKDTRAIMTADRQKKVAVTAAEQEAQESLVKDIKAAEAQEISAKHLAAQEVTMAQAELQKSEKLSQAKTTLAQGVTAEEAAKGLAEVRVKEADADAIEKIGAAEAKAYRLKVEAEAHGVAQKGEADAVAIKEMALAEAAGVQEKGVAEATATSAKAEADEKYWLAEATGTKEKLLAEAAGTKEQALAEAVGTKEKMLAEANGLTEKAEAMKALDEASREHEEFRINLEKEKDVELATVEARQKVYMEQAKVLGEAFKHTKIDIVGGDGQFFDRFINAVGGGKAVDGFVDKSNVMQTLGKEYLSGESSLVKDLKEILSKTNVDAEDLKNLSVTALLAKLMSSAEDGATKKKIEKLIGRAKQLGLKDTD